MELTWALNSTLAAIVLLDRVRLTTAIKCENLMLVERAVGNCVYWCFCLKARIEEGSGTVTPRKGILS